MNWLRKLLGLHVWRYRNPYDRTCSVCGRHEVAHCWAWGGNSWWEVFNEGESRKHKKGGVA